MIKYITKTLKFYIEIQKLVTDLKLMGIEDPQKLIKERWKKEYERSCFEAIDEIRRRAAFGVGSLIERKGEL